ICLTVIPPGDDEAAIGEGGNLGGGLAALDGRIDEDFGPGGRPVRLEHLRLDGGKALVAASAANAAAVVLPCDDEAAIAQRRDLGNELVALGRRVDEDFGAGGRPVRLEHL